MREASEATAREFSDFLTQKKDFLRFVYDLDARAVVMENVPEAVSYGEMNIPEIKVELEFK